MSNIIYYKRVDFPEEESFTKKMQEYFLNSNFENDLVIENHFTWNKLSDKHYQEIMRIPELQNWLIENDIICYRLAAIRVPPLTRENMHIDIVNPTIAYGMNFPIQNCDNTHTIFFKDPLDKPLQIVEKLHYIRKSDNKPVNYWSVSSPLIEATRVTVNKGYWLNVREPHLIDNPNDSVRITLSLNLQQLPAYMRNPHNSARVFI